MIPMLCDNFREGFIKYPAIIQPKIDGVHCTALPAYETYDLFSRKETQFHINNIIREMSTVLRIHPEFENIIWDGEIYIPGKFLADISGACRNDGNELHDKLEFWMFDCVSDKSIEDRIAIVERFTTLCGGRIKAVPSKVILSDAEAIEMTDEFISNGFEGGVVKLMNEPYLGDYSHKLFKIKKEKTKEFVIVDIVCTNDHPSYYSVSFVLQNDITGGTFRSNAMGTVEQKQSYMFFRESLIGKQATIKFYDRSKYGLPVHSNMVCIRDYE